MEGNFEVVFFVNGRDFLFLLIDIFVLFFFFNIVLVLLLVYLSNDDVCEIVGILEFI